MYHSHPQTLHKNSVLPYLSMHSLIIPITSYMCNKCLPITLSYLSVAEYLELSHLKYLVFKQDHVTSINTSNYLNLRYFQIKSLKFLLIFPEMNQL